MNETTTTAAPVIDAEKQVRIDKCAACGAVNRAGLKFWIGAKPDPNPLDESGGFVMVEGTGRIVCPACYLAESAKGAARINKLVEV